MGGTVKANQPWTWLKPDIDFCDGPNVRTMAGVTLDSNNVKKNDSLYVDNPSLSKYFRKCIFESVSSAGFRSVC